jgi:hypothetical protein
MEVHLLTTTSCGRDAHESEGAHAVKIEEKARPHT